MAARATLSAGIPRRSAYKAGSPGSWATPGQRGDTGRRAWQPQKKAGNTLERARTLLEMGARLVDAALIGQARAVFEQTGARVDLAFSLHALVRRTAADVGADTDLALSRYSEAIALLDAVKAELSLGLACQERAVLLVRRGRRDEARADLERARRSFEAVGAETRNVDGELRALATA